ncbi:cytochrome P450 [Fistulina hepatica ATCC 64428]|uniref:Cytochrome P450 n=1 Tax=Fistulina hepatica ATCC 64428 TaxID=1128425 RepID=A0A0D7AC26_9AGAR|nr:cytochrome P450 [Fistulina hepatica ATCC 64428]
MDRASPLLALFLLVGFLWLFKWRSKVVYPPGPPSLPLIGHLGQLPSERAQDIFYEWSKTYGDVMCLRVPGKNIVVLNSHEAASELLERRSAIYSSRPAFVTMEIMGWEHTLVFLPYHSAEFPIHRRIMHKYLDRQEAEAHRHLLEQLAQQTAERLHAPPGSYDAELLRYTILMTLKIAFGYDGKSDSDDMFHLGEQVLHVMNTAGPIGNTIVDHVPWFRHLPPWFPGMRYVNRARQSRRIVRNFYDYCFNFVMERKRGGNESVEASILGSEIENVSQEVDVAKHCELLTGLAVQIFVAASDTTWTTLSIFVIMMVLHPDIQRKAQTELDKVTEGTRLPNFEDHGALPYIDCIVQELLRFHPVLPLGMFTLNLIVCPGRFLAEDAIWILVASVLTVYDIHGVVGADEQNVPPKLVFSQGMVEHPESIKCEFRPRSAEALKLVTSTLLQFYPLNEMQFQEVWFLYGQMGQRLLQRSR